MRRLSREPASHRSRRSDRWCLLPAECQLPVAPLPVERLLERRSRRPARASPTGSCRLLLRLGELSGEGVRNLNWPLPLMIRPDLETSGSVAFTWLRRAARLRSAWSGALSRAPGSAVRLSPSAPSSSGRSTNLLRSTRMGASSAASGECWEGFIRLRFGLGLVRKRNLLTGTAGISSGLIVHL